MVESYIFREKTYGREYGKELGRLLIMKPVSTLIDISFASNIDVTFILSAFENRLRIGNKAIVQYAFKCGANEDQLFNINLAFEHMNQFSPVFGAPFSYFGRKDLTLYKEIMSILNNNLSMRVADMQKELSTLGIRKQNSNVSKLMKQMFDRRLIERRSCQRINNNFSKQKEFEYFLRKPSHYERVIEVIN